MGAEFGTTTGRRRRCGWLDLAVLKYSNMINGYTSLNITKLDVLDQLDEVKLGIAYRFNGELLDSFPSDLSVLEKVEVVYETMKGWNTDISQCRTVEELPLNAQKYIQRIEELIGVKVQYIGVGPSRDAMIKVY